MSILRSFGTFAAKPVVDEIRSLNWLDATIANIMGAARTYYYFSIQFRKNLEFLLVLNLSKKVQNLKLLELTVT